MNKDVRKTKVLFLCTGNTARSQMAEAFLRAYGGDRFEPYSAGLEPDVINPFVYRVLEEVGFDLEGQYSKSVMDYMGKIHFGFLITVCANAEERCPSVFPGVGQRLHWPFEDPAAFEGTEEEKLAKFREIRDQIEARIKTWLAGIFSISWGAVAGLPTEPQRARSGDRPERVCPGLLRRYLTRCLQVAGLRSGFRITIRRAQGEWIRCLDDLERLIGRDGGDVVVDDVLAALGHRLPVGIQKSLGGGMIGLDILNKLAGGARRVDLLGDGLHLRAGLVEETLARLQQFIGVVIHQTNPPGSRR